jgi:hypothetical protein
LVFKILAVVSALIGLAAAIVAPPSIGEEPAELRFARTVVSISDVSALQS